MKELIGKCIEVNVCPDHVQLKDTWDNETVLIVGEKEIEKLHAILGVWLQEYDYAKTDN